jgi:hypothetical protein
MMRPLGSGLVWRRGCTDPRVHEFARVVEETVKAESNWQGSQHTAGDVQPAWE